MKVFVIILNYGQFKTTQDCVKSIFDQEKDFAKIIVVNNDKEKISVNDFAENRQLEVINNKRNVGFAAGVNIGIKHALSEGADAVFLLNNDAKIKKALLPILIKDLQDHGEVGIVGPAIEFRKDRKTLYDLGGYINPFVGRTSHRNVEKINTHQLVYPQYISGCCMLIRREVFEKIGYFDDRFFLYYEDVDFCLRTAKKKWKIALDPTAVLFHGLSKSIGKSSRITIYHQTRSALLFGGKYFKWSIKRIYNFIFVLLQSTIFVMHYPKSGFAAFFAVINYITRNE